MKINVLFLLFLLISCRSENQVSSTTKPIAPKKVVVQESSAQIQSMSLISIFEGFQTETPISMVKSSEHHSLRLKLLRNFLIDQFTRTDLELSQFNESDKSKELYKIKFNPIAIEKIHHSLNGNVELALKYKGFPESVEEIEFFLWDHYEDKEITPLMKQVVNRDKNEATIHFAFSQSEFLKVLENEGYLIVSRDNAKLKFSQAIVSTKNKIVNLSQVGATETSKSLSNFTDDFEATSFDKFKSLKALVKPSLEGIPVETYLLISPEEIIELYPFFQKRVESFSIIEGKKKVQSKSAHGYRFQIKTFKKEYLFNEVWETKQASYKVNYNHISVECDFFMRRKTGLVKKLWQRKTDNLFLNSDKGQEKIHSKHRQNTGLNSVDFTFNVVPSQNFLIKRQLGFTGSERCNVGRKAWSLFNKTRNESKEFKDEHPFEYQVELELFSFPWEQVTWK